MRDLRVMICGNRLIFERENLFKFNILRSCCTERKELRFEISDLIGSNKPEMPAFNREFLRRQTAEIFRMELAAQLFGKWNQPDRKPIEQKSGDADA